MLLYPDTSVLVAAVALEPETERVHKWLAANLRDISISDWSIAEFASALSVKLRFGTLSAEQRSAGTAWFRSLITESVAVSPVSRASFRRAADLVSAADAKIRAPDALHLAIAEEIGATFVTFDTMQAQAAVAAGIALASI